VSVTDECSCGRKAASEIRAVLAEEVIRERADGNLLRPNVLFAFDHDGEPLAAEHGGPLSCRAATVRVEEREMVRGFTLSITTTRLLGAQRLSEYGDPGKSSAIRRRKSV